MATTTRYIREHGGSECADKHDRRSLLDTGLSFRDLSVLLCAFLRLHTWMNGQCADMSDGCSLFIRLYECC